MVHGQFALVVCAQEAVREQFEGPLRSCGLQPVLVSTLGDARDMLRRQEFALTLSYDVLPDGNFRGVIRAAQESTSKPAVIVLSRHAEWDAYLHAIGGGAFDYIACPCDLVEARRILWSALSESLRGQHSSEAAA